MLTGVERNIGYVSPEKQNIAWQEAKELSIPKL